MTAPIFRIISDDKVIVARWQKALQKEGWTVTTSGLCHEVPPASNAPGIYLIEIGPAACNAPEDLKKLQGPGKSLSTFVFGDAQKITNRQIAAFLEGGADDFVYKNLDERVLMAKLKAHIRRIMPAIKEASQRCASGSGDIKRDSKQRSVRIESGHGKYTELLNLTQKELDILTLLLGHEKQVVTREAMLEKLWGDKAADVYSECVDKHIESLRRKLGLYGKRIRTVYGTGYMFTDKE
jgi:DNA-binding response OmpR family regulator